jgi:hypothetical protein
MNYKNWKNNLVFNIINKSKKEKKKKKVKILVLKSKFKKEKWVSVNQQSSYLNQ